MAKKKTEDTIKSGRRNITTEYGGVEVEYDLNPGSGLPDNNDRAVEIEVAGTTFYVNKPSNVSPSLKELLGVSDDPKEIIRRCRDAYKQEDLPGGIVDICIDFLCDGFVNRHPDPKVREFYDEWNKAVKLKQTLKWVAMGYFIDGTVDVYKVVGNYKPRTSNGIVGTVKDKLTTLLKGNPQIPTAYTCLDIMNVEPTGSQLFGDLALSLSPPKELVAVLQKTPKDLSDDEKQMIQNLPSDFKKSAIQGQPMLLKSSSVSRIKRKARPFELYGHSLIERSLGAIEMFKKMRYADLTTIDGIVNQIVLFTVGSDVLPAKPAEIQALANAVKKVGFAKAFKLYWNHTLKITRIMPENVSEILGEAKYEPIKASIKEGMGSIDIFLGGAGGGKGANFNTAFVSIRALEKALQSAADDIVNYWLADDYKFVAEQMKFDEPATPVFSNLEFIDVVKWGMLMAQLVDRGIVSVDDASEAIGFDFNQSQIQIQAEKKLRQKGILPPLGSPTQMTKNGVAVPNQGKPIQPGGKTMPGRDSTTPQTSPGAAPLGPKGDKTNPKLPKK